MVNVNDILQNQQFLDWYFKTSPETVSDWEQILNNHPDWKPAVEDAIEWLQNLQLKEKSIAQAQVEASYSRLQQSLEGLTESKVVNMRSRAIRWWMASAAAIILAVAAIWMFTGTKSNSIQTQYGEVSAKVLPDGSEVTLNAHTSISYGKGWQEGNEREVWLKGEAYFHVKKTPQKSRFIVHTDRFDIIVTGTQFNVINRDGKTSVLLNEGSVTIKGKDGKEIKMVPGDYVEMKDNAPEKTPLPNANSVTAWKDKKMLFENTSIENVAKMIEETYGMKVQVEPSASTKTPDGVSGVMSNENLDVLLQALQLLYVDLSIEKKEDTIIIK
ncbi:FecR family protein [Pinibacter aurantiacus]|uniref:FecR domain-containing protein n=1 Tax=Pinibacter aurantiacus TaxID=2851599 RepID=A0A9E2W8S7_9BACT|nr:FecR domain-containing protein [Pinibacter aurantiacus]MBV4358622.1 FecR domain-containing protein [Pinibacter aurantiacus]